MLSILSHNKPTAQLQQLTHDLCFLSQYPMQFNFLTLGYFEANPEWRCWDLSELKGHCQSLFWVTPLVPWVSSQHFPTWWLLNANSVRPWDSAYTWSRPVTFSSTVTSSLVILACSLCPHSCLGLGSPPPPPLLAWSCPQLEADRTVYKAQSTMTPRAVSPPRLSVHVRILLELMRGLEEREQKPTP